MKVFAKSDVGRVREMNQDYFYISKPEDGIQLYIVADGMGGYKGGEIASKLAVETSKKYILNNINVIFSQDRDEIIKLIKGAIEYANMVVFDKSKEVSELENMGTTIDVCVIVSNKIYIGHVGDSRVYRKRSHFFRKLTTDHSYVQKLVSDGTITKEEAYNHPKKNMLIKALGCSPYVEPDVMVKGFLRDDVILMCSDGLTNMVGEEEIASIIEENPELACNSLVSKANENGGYDNITAVIIL
ncbi:MAG: Stp1/IreP family PP2C-type Ser/Thr phosphatase [Clostridiales bacterium]|nr:Stp1/IreP family PP2C-type Ser/Thr phosphatase [Clostridiales bacterium]